MQFSPSCSCCDTPSPCGLCDEGTSQVEYTLTFWGGEAEESEIVVSSLGHPCYWSYRGVIGDIQGINDDGNGTCDENTVLDVIVRLRYNNTDPFMPTGWLWHLQVIVACVTPGQQNRGLIEDFNVISATDPEPPPQTQDCDLTTGVDFTIPQTYNYYSDYGGTCDWPPASLKLGCLDCKHVGGVYSCNYPGGTFCHMENTV